MKLSKLYCVSVTSAAVMVFGSGVYLIQVSKVFATDDSALSLPPVTKTVGFGGVVKLWMEDLSERLNNNPAVVFENAEKALAEISESSISTDGDASERLERARARYEEKLAKLEQLTNGLSDEQKADILERLAKHQVVLEKVFTNAPESATAGVQRALQNAQEHEEKILNRVSKNKEAIKQKVEARLEMLEKEVEKEDEKASPSGKLSANEKALRLEREKRLEELKDNLKSDDAKSDKELNAAAKKQLKERIKEDKKQAVEKEREAKKTAQEKFKEQVMEKKNVKNSGEKPESSVETSEDIRKVQGAMDWQPQGLLERFGYWLAGR